MLGQNWSSQKSSIVGIGMSRIFSCQIVRFLQIIRPKTFDIQARVKWIPNVSQLCAYGAQRPCFLNVGHDWMNDCWFIGPN